MLEQDGSKENPLYSEEKEVKILSYHLNASPINKGKAGNTQPLALYFLNVLYFCGVFRGVLRGYSGKVKTKDLLLPLAQNVVKSALIQVCVWDPLPTSARLCLWGKPSARTSDRQGRSVGTVRPPENSEPSLWRWYVLWEHLGKEREISS